VLLTSPENPTGQFWTAEDLGSIANLCQARGFPLVVDHCFYLAGVHDVTLPSVWQVGDLIDCWIGIWDTGKTFGLNGEKLGFLLCSDSMAGHVDDALRVLQFDTSRRQRLFFTEVMRVAPYFDYLINLRRTCQDNLDALVALSSAHDIVCLRPPAGSLALLDIASLGIADREFQAALLEAGVGLVTGSSFFHGPTTRDTLMRVALARERSTFDQALEVINDLLSSGRLRRGESARRT
jgi:aspartate/methionine/tyrosine aminotransferase